MKYALKIIDKDRITDELSRKQLLREKEITSKLDHPNISKFHFLTKLTIIVRLESYFHDRDNIYFLLSLCRVGDLEGSLIKDYGNLSTNMTRFYTMELILALEHMHDHNIVHRDLKPKNILVNDQFHVEIADFGNAIEIDPDQILEELQEVGFEQDSNSSGSSARSDQFEPDSHVDDNYFGKQFFQAYSNI